MKQTLFCILLLPWAAFLFHSCAYEPTEIFERTVNKNVSAPQIQTVSLNQFLYCDTIHIYGKDTIRFKFKSSNQEIKNVKFSIDGQEQATVESNNGLFELSSYKLSSGVHTFKMDVITKSGTGSIADIIGAEGFVTSKTWTMIVKQGYYTQLNAKAKNGYLSLSWPKYENCDFKEYVIYRYDYIKNVEIKRIVTSEFTDSTYVGEGSVYYVSVNTQEGTLVGWGSLELQKELPKLSFIATQNNQYWVKFTKPQYYNAVDTCVILQKLNYVTNYTISKQTRDMNDTAYNLVSARFNDVGYVKLHVVPKKPNVQYLASNFYKYEVEMSLKIGFLYNRTQNQVDNIHQTGIDEFIFLSNSDSIFRYSVSKKKIVDKLGYSVSGCYGSSFNNLMVSAKGQLLTTTLMCTLNVLASKTSSLNNYSLRDLRSYTGQQYIPGIPISDNGIGILNNVNGGFYLYDFNSNTKLGYYNKNSSGGYGEKISSNGDYMFITSNGISVTQFKNSIFTEIWQIPTSTNYLFYEFDGSNPNQLVVWDGNTLSVKQCANSSTIYSFPLNDKGIFNIDYYNQKMLTYTIGHLYVRSYIDGSLIKDIPVNIDLNSWINACCLVNNAIMSLNGVLYFIN